MPLSAAEGRDERNTLALAGASPRTLRGTTARRALVLTFLGAVIAVPMGFIPAAEIVVLHVHYQLHFPTMLVVLLVGIVPLAAAAITGVSSAVALAVRPVRVSTHRDD